MITPSSTARAGEVVNSASPEAADLTGFDIHRLDCAVDALKGADLTPYRHELRRIADNIKDLIGTDQ